jgi:hypothetical protein
MSNFLMVGTKMGYKLFVTSHHIEIFVQGLVGKKVGGLEDPCTFGASPLLSFVLPDELSTYRHINSPKMPDGLDAQGSSLQLPDWVECFA